MKEMDLGFDPDHLDLRRVGEVHIDVAIGLAVGLAHEFGAEKGYANWHGFTSNSLETIQHSATQPRDAASGGGVDLRWRYKRCRLAAA
jgi:hypothetical protein